MNRSADGIGLAIGVFACGKRTRNLDEETRWSDVLSIEVVSSEPHRSLRVPRALACRYNTRPAAAQAGSPGSYRRRTAPIAGGVSGQHGRGGSDRRAEQTMRGLRDRSVSHGWQGAKGADNPAILLRAIQQPAGCDDRSEPAVCAPGKWR